MSIPGPAPTEPALIYGATLEFEDGVLFNARVDDLDVVADTP